MTVRKYSSRAQQTTLASAITDTATSMTVVSGSALMGGKTLTGSETYTVVIDPDTSLEEIVDVKLYSSGNSLTIERNRDGSAAVAHSAGAIVRHMIIGRDLQEANTHQELTSGVHGVTGEVVGTTDEQVLSGKTLTSPIITNPTITGGFMNDSSITFEGSTADASETTLTITNPTTDRTITFPDATGQVVLRDTADTLSNKTLGNALNAGGYKITNLATPTDASDAVRKDFADAQVAAAATSATSAAASATAAATSASSAATSASSALTSANSASTSAASALTSANSAATSASTMAASVAAAATSATSAAASATAAATSASSAATSASNALTSANSASTSASAASTSATSAAASATAAATSASSASTSASSALTSANSASASVTAAATSASSAATSAASAATSASSAAASFDSFDDRYLGPKASAPTVDNDGNPLTSGVLYYNTTSGVMFVYNGNTSAWEQVAVSTTGFPTLAGNNDFTGLNTFTNAGTADVLRVTNTGTGNSFVVEDSANPDSSPTVIDATGNLVRGYTTWYDVGLTNGGIEVQSNSGTNYGGLNLIGWRNNVALPAALHFAKSNSSAHGTHTAVSTGTDLGRIGFYGSDGTEFIASSLILGEAEGTISTGVVPGRLIFSTANSAGTLTERMRIDSAGQVGIGTSPSTTLHVSSGSGARVRAGGATGSGFEFNDADTRFDIPAANTIAAYTSNTERMRITSGGLVGIGMTPAVTLDITGANVRLTPNTNVATNGFTFNGSSGNALWATMQSYKTQIDGVTRFEVLGSGITSVGTSAGTAMMQIVNIGSNTANPVLVVKGAASQSGALQQWQNSSGTVLASVNSTGQFVGDGSQLTGISAGVSVATLEEVEQQVIMGALL